MDDLKNDLQEDLTYKQLEKKEVYKGKRVAIEEVTYTNENGVIINREHIISEPAVVILNITDDGYVYMVKESRTPINKKNVSLPAGVIEPGETPKEAALRELEEEIGYKAKNIKFLRAFYSSVGISNEKIYMFLATNLVKTRQNLGVTEDITVIKLSLSKLKEMLDKGQIITASSNIALLHYFLYEDKNSDIL